MTNDINKNIFCISTKAYEGTNEVEISNDFIVPDYISDIKKILSIHSTVRKDGVYPDNSKLEYDGTVYYTLMLMTESNEIKSMHCKSEFSDETVIRDIPDNAIYDAIMTIDNTSARLSNPRKINIKTKVNTHISVTEKKCIEPDIKGLNTVEEEFLLEKNELELEVLENCFSQSDSLAISEDIEIPADYKPIGELLQVNTVPIIYECKCSDGSVVIRGELVASILYIAENPPAPDGQSENDFEYVSYTHKIPISQIITNECANEGSFCFCDITAYDINTSVQDNTNGEKKLIELDFSYDIRTECIQNIPVHFINDMYSTTNECTAEYKNIDIHTIKKTYSKNFTFNETVNASQPFEQIIDGSFNICECNIYVENGKVFARGKLNADFITLYEKEFNGNTMSFPFNYELDSSKHLDAYDYTVICRTSGSSIRIVNDKIVFDTEIFINAAVYENKSIDVLCKLNVLDKKTDIGNDTKIVIYYPQKDETLWEIAKKYHITSDDIRAMNNVNSENYKNKKSIIIPLKTNKAPILQKII